MLKNRVGNQMVAGSSPSQRPESVHKILQEMLNYSRKILWCIKWGECHCEVKNLLNLLQPALAKYYE